MEQASREVKKNTPNFGNGAPMGTQLRNFKDRADDRYIVVGNLTELINNSVSKDKIRIKGNMDILFDISDIPDIEIEGNLRCKNVKTSNRISVSGSIKADSIEASHIHAGNIACLIIAAEEITADDKIFSNSVSGRSISAKEMHVTGDVVGDSIHAALIYARDVTAKIIVSTEIEAKDMISCDSLKAKRAKAMRINAKESEIEERIETGEKT